ncbi:hypothetical protein, partial [Streptococcus suis]
GLQKLVNKFIVPYNHKDKKKTTEVISNNHNEPSSDIDFAHTMTTLASLEKQDNHLNNMTKGIFSLKHPQYLWLLVKSGKLGEALVQYDLGKAFAG